jgi:hypothetical protein
MQLRFSQDIETLLKRLANQPLTIGDILAQTSERGFSLLTVLFTLPFLAPVMPPGLSTIAGAGCFLIGIQMAIGIRKLWLPRKISRFQFPAKFSASLLKSLGKITSLLTKIVRPRMSGIAENRYVWRLNGLCIAWLALLLSLPVSFIPFSNTIPAIAILVLAVATLEADGLFIGVGYVLTTINTLFFGAIGYLLWQAPHILSNFMRAIGINLNF